MSKRTVRGLSRVGISHRILFLWICVLLVCVVDSRKHIYASEKECDRFSLDAIYYERFKVITENVFKDCQEFVNRVADLVCESLTSIMAELPNKDASDDQEKKIFSQFKAMKNAFSSRMKKAQRKITRAWEALVASHFDLMYDNGKSSLEDYLNKTHNMTNAYDEARKSVDGSMESFVGFVKGVVRDGLQGINGAAELSLRKEEEAAKNKTQEDDSDGEETKANQDKDSKEERLQKKKLEIAEMIVHGFLGKVTVEVIKRKMDLFKKVTLKQEERDSVLDDLLFDLLMVKSRMRAIIHDDIPDDKGSIDLARRSVYTYWADMAEGMYKEKIKAKQSSEPGSDAYYRKLWGDEKQLSVGFQDFKMNRGEGMPKYWNDLNKSKQSAWPTRL